ncbi:hypothetical protein PS928_06396 [Pseudomonas fluorescens]|uniref:Uncharacterized protein n=1 Tax=Pseudomonas fluorescens TaxID=294 RepID=A0A5E7VTH4_PSEFL|nr:hypothetical protein PS928_06396 [Pseudomonas fluorescens]
MATPTKIIVAKNKTYRSHPYIKYKVQAKNNTKNTE